MSTTLMSNEPTAKTTQGMVDMKLEVVVLPVSDVERAKRFYGGLGWRLDGDFVAGDTFRVVQFTPPGSPCSVHFGKGITSAAPGSASGAYLVVSDIEAARAELAVAGVKVSEPFHVAGPGKPRQSGLDPERRSYSSYATFSDPDGNGWVLQEINTRFPGRGLSSLDVATLVPLLRERRNTTASTKQPPRSTTGRNGTRRTSSRASAAGRPRTQPKMRRSI
jgi:catechol 2,3-dioxygenase-like lactoylglutathione lyase family enzyme